MDLYFLYGMNQLPLAHPPLTSSYRSIGWCILRGSVYGRRDPDGQPSLSPEQGMVSPVWRRPQTRTSTYASSSGVAALFDKEDGGLLPEHILQHVVTDCSVCASISVSLEHGRRFGSNVSSPVPPGNNTITLSCSLPNHVCMFLMEDPLDLLQGRTFIMGDTTSDSSSMAHGDV